MAQSDSPEATDSSRVCTDFAKSIFRFSSISACEVFGYCPAIEVRVPRMQGVWTREAVSMNGLDPGRIGILVEHHEDWTALHREKYLDSILGHPHVTTAEKVRQFVRALLASGRCSIEQVAQHLGMDRGTVQHHLAGDAETFSSIVDAARVERATRYLTTTDRPLAEVADLLGFPGLSALSRWFSGRFDCNASAWRAGHRGRMVPAR